MGIERKKLAGILRTVPVDYFGEQLSVTYKPAQMTPQRSAQLAQAREEAEEAEGDSALGAEAQAGALLAERLADALVSWDVMEDGQPLPPTKENLMTFANALLVHIAGALGEDQAPNRKTGKRSSAS